MRKAPFTTRGFSVAFKAYIFVRADIRVQNYKRICLVQKKSSRQTKDVRIQLIPSMEIKHTNLKHRHETIGIIHYTR